MSWIELAAIFQVFGGVCGVAGLIGSLYLRSTFVPRKYFEEQLLRLEAQLTKAIAEHQHERSAMAVSIAEIKGVTDRLDATQAHLARQVDRMEGIFMRDGRIA